MLHQTPEPVGGCRRELLYRPVMEGGGGGCIPQEQGHTSAKDSRLSGGPAGEA